MNGLRKAICEAIYEGMRADSSVFILGEGAKVKAQLDYPELLQEFPDRVLTMPICEAAMVNMALGASIMGLRPIVDLTFNDLILRAADEILNEVAKIGVMSGGKLKARVIIKVEYTKYENAQAGNRYDYLFERTPPNSNLKVAIPQTPQEAKEQMTKALHADYPSIFFEDRLI